MNPLLLGVRGFPPYVTPGRNLSPSPHHLSSLLGWVLNRNEITKGVGP